MTVRSTTTAFLAWALVAAPGAAVDAVSTVAPGSPQRVEEIADRCPTFHWGAESAIAAWELLVFQLGPAAAEPSVVLRVSLPGGARGWTPPLEQCLEAGGEYAWTLGAAQEEGTVWSEVRLFRISPILGSGLVGAPRDDHGASRSRRSRPDAPAVEGAAADRAPAAPGRGSNDGKSAVTRASGRRLEAVLKNLRGARGPAAAVRGRRAEAARKDAHAGSSPDAPTLGSPSLTVEDDIHLADVSSFFKNDHLFLWSSDANTALGHDALSQNSSGDGNTAAGFVALSANGTGSWSTAFGSFALANSQEGDDNTALGHRTLQDLDDAANGAFNTAVGSRALTHMTAGSNATAVGFYAVGSAEQPGGTTAVGALTLFNQETPSFNTALGTFALYNSTTGSSNTAVGGWALYGGYDEYGNPLMTGYRNTAVGLYTLLSNTTGYKNTALGSVALALNTTGYRNTASGNGALLRNTEGHHNTATGNGALVANTLGNYNTAGGNVALGYNTTGSYNSALGHFALRSATTGYPDYDGLGVGDHNSALGAFTMYVNTEGSENTAVGSRALQANTTGARNTALGRRAGYAITTGSDNILIGHEGVAADESNTIRIGSHPANIQDPGEGEHARAFLAGVYSQSIGGTSHAVCVDDAGQLGSCPPSSARFKQEIRDLDPASSAVLGLRPVTFRFREGLWGGPGEQQIGLIAEEVAELYPALVGFDEQGRPTRVRYELLSVLLLDELQRQRREIQALEKRLRAPVPSGPHSGERARSPG